MTSEKIPEDNMPIEKILTIDEVDYFMMTGKEPTDYNAIGVHLVCGKEFDTCGRYASQALSPLEAFAAQVPKSAEIVVGYRSSVSTSQRGGVGNPTTVGYTVSGTALVPKKPSLPEHKE